LIQKGLCSCN